jgi:urease beta subunit
MGEVKRILRNFWGWLIRVGSGCHYHFFDIEKNRGFDKTTIKKRLTLLINVAV